MNKPLKTIIVGGGHRSLTYAALSEIESDKMEIVGVADPDKNRRESIAKRFGIPDDKCFESAEELAKAQSKPLPFCRIFWQPQQAHGLHFR